MLTFNDVEKIVKKYNYRYENNILFGINKVKVKSVIPLGPLTVYTYNEVHNFLFRFSDESINIMKLKRGKTDEVEDNTLISWKYIKELKIKKGLMSYNMAIILEGGKLEYTFNKFVLGNPWVKENIKWLEEVDFYRK